MNLNKNIFIALVVAAFIVGGVLTAAVMSWASEDEVQNEQVEEEQQEEEVEEEDEESSETEEESNDSDSNDDQDQSAQYERIERALQLIEENYISEVSEDELLEGAIEGMVSSLDDPFSEYMDPETTEQFNSQLESSFEGIGAEVTQRDGHVTIIAPLKDSPAEDSGVRPNDRILEVDGESLDGYTVNEAVALIRGEKGTDVTLLIDRPGEEDPFEVVITRDTIPLTTVYAEVEMQGDRPVGVMEIRSFGEGTSQEFEEELTRLEEEENIEGLVIDVRGNPGGLFTSVEEILSNFMDGDEPYVQTARHDIEPEPYYVDGDGPKDYPVSVLINEGSASASEILAAALKEVRGYDIVGQTTFGKGTVQQTLPLGDGMLKVTILNWLSPEGNQIDEVGVDPTIEVRQPEYYYLTLIQSDEELAFDMNNSEVEKLQLMLDGLGYDTNRSDGYFDETTEAAVESFQQDEGLDVTGTVNEETENRLEELILEFIQDPENDEQLQAALDALFE